MKKNHVTPYLITCLFLLLCSCESDDGEESMPNTDSAGFTIDVSGDFSRDMQGTNATFKFNEMPNGFVTTHQLAIYLVDDDGYTITAFIMQNGTSLPGTGTYNITDYSSGEGLKEYDAGFTFGQNGGLSHNSIGSTIGKLNITKTGDGFVQGTLVTALSPIQNGMGSISVNGSFYAVHVP